MRPCLGCGRLISRKSYCHMCDPMNARRIEKRGSGWQQTKFREAVLKAAGNKCERCGATGVPLQAHHLVPVAQRPQAHDPMEGAALCEPCHRLA